MGYENERTQKLNRADLDLNKKRHRSTCHYKNINGHCTFEYGGATERERE